MDYNNMLEDGYSNLPESVLAAERFEIPKTRGHIQGNKTVLSNFYQIADALGRKPEHLLKFILKELATPGDAKKNAVILGRKISASSVNEKIRQYAELFVLCPECKRPDTKLVKEGSSNFMKCLACGSKKIIKAKI